MCMGFARGLFGLLGFDLESQSWLPLLPSELHLGFHLGSLGFQLGSSWAPSGLHLGSIWDSILDHLDHLDHLDSILEILPDGSGKVFLSTSYTQIVQT